MVEQSELNRLFWHSRRGMLELDVLLVPFVQEVYPTLDAENQARYRKLLECEDQDMFGWFMPVSYTHLDVYKRQGCSRLTTRTPCLRYTAS